MNLLMTFDGTAAKFTTQDGQRLTAVCANCGAYWLNGQLMHGSSRDAQCPHTSPVNMVFDAVTPAVAAPPPPIEAVAIAHQNSVLRDVIMSFERKAEAANLNPEDLAKIKSDLADIEAELTREMPHA